MPEAFVPLSNGWRLQRGYQIKPEYRVVEDERELGNTTSTAVSRTARRNITMTMTATTRSAYGYMMSFFNRNVGPAGRFTFSWAEFVPSPDAGPVLTAVESGDQPARTIFVKFAWKNSVGTTEASPATSLAIPDDELIKVTLPFYPPSVTQAVIYATQGSAGTELEQATLTTDRTWTQNNGELSTSPGDPPTENTATESPTCKLAQDGLSITRGIGTSYTASIQLQEV